ncbi:MAG: protein-methionine-sulfoxide reductase catalytic subunit MsrP [Chloroflexota bacterium]
MINKSYHDNSIKSSEITPKKVYLSRRDFMKMGVVSAAAAFLAACTGEVENSVSLLTPSAITSVDESRVKGTMDELGSALTPFKAVTNYNNFYEFSLGKEEVANMTTKFNPLPWSLEVSGLVRNPKTFGFEDILKKYSQEERIYRLRCVEGWSMVIPWLGFPLAQLLKEADPLSDAKYVRFVSVSRPEEMPGQSNPSFPWPYQEGLRIDEAMHDLTILATGLYGDPLPAQNGAPIRLVVPWKYGFKSIKSVVKIELVNEQPSTLWSSVSAEEYGFYSNVNPKHAHPRWSQTSERRIGEFSRRDTLMFNGYASQIAGLYQGMDLDLNF